MSAIRKAGHHAVQDVLDIRTDAHAVWRPKESAPLRTTPQFPASR
jgi:hypothetical protein